MTSRSRAVFVILAAITLCACAGTYVAGGAGAHHASFAPARP